MATQSKMVFTIEAANRALPLVRSIVGDVQERWKDLVKVREEYGNSSPEHDHIMRELSEYIQELKVIGCHLKDFERGLVEFPSSLEGKDVCLSWQPEEPEIAFITDADGNLESRRRIPGVRRAEDPSQN
jgi:hypothetical protein